MKRWSGAVGWSLHCTKVPTRHGALLQATEFYEKALQPAVNFHSRITIGSQSPCPSLSLFVRRGAEVAALFSSLEFVVIDELHAFIGQERGKQLQSLLHS